MSFYKNGWTREKVIEKVKKEFRGKSINSSDGCLYRTKGGKKCIAGVFISDKAYENHIKGILNSCPIDDTGVWEITRKQMPLSKRYMRYWQQTHDNLSRVKTVKQQQKDLIDKLIRMEEEHA